MIREVLGLFKIKEGSENNERLSVSLSSGTGCQICHRLVFDLSDDGVLLFTLSHAGNAV